ncbi:hypothetical protein SBRY_50765 [Actinacidiphila bryophytorum]|uniref:Uncharacterized protein n=1 Tax=Actinacidiphila bryophytorum TaxID=1436133 RepID=A0A9W4H5G2_9ACTN|nr:hypothetical protein SBRY_50765 [Actinacidiphila bryophytorum]
MDVTGSSPRAASFVADPRWGCGRHRYARARVRLRPERESRPRPGPRRGRAHVRLPRALAAVARRRRTRLHHGLAVRRGLPGDLRHVQGLLPARREPRLPGAARHAAAGDPDVQLAQGAAALRGQGVQVLRDHRRRGARPAADRLRLRPRHRRAAPDGLRREGRRADGRLHDAPDVRLRLSVSFGSLCPPVTG